MAKPEFIVDPVTIPPNSDIPWNRWPGRVAAAKQIGASPLQFRQLIQEGAVKEYRAPDESRRYDPSELDELAATFAADRDSDETTVGGKPIEGMRAATDLLKQSQGHNERLLNTAIVGFEKCMTAMTSIVQYLTNENQQLTDTVCRQNAAFQQAEALQLTQAAELAERTAVQDRRNALLSALLPHVAPAVQKLTGMAEQFLGHQTEPCAAPDATSEQAEIQVPKIEPDDLESKAIELLKRIGPEKLRLAASILDEEDQPLATEVVEALEKVRSTT
jgi:hypothetical protein